jgi:hypothetical protein
MTEPVGQTQTEAVNSVQGPSGTTVTGIQRVPARDISVVSKLSDQLNDQNWQVWKEWMKHILHLYGVEKYAYGTIERPTDPENDDIWGENDNYTQVIIVMSISSSEMIHMSQCQMASAMWRSLEAVHETKGHQTIVA